jgi:hypothetical protein
MSYNVRSAKENAPRFRIAAGAGFMNRRKQVSCNSMRNAFGIFTKPNCWAVLFRRMLYGIILKEGGC